MRNRQSLPSWILFCTVIGVLLCGIFATELPELLSLTDSTSNDFTVRDAAARFPQPHNSTAAGTFGAFDLKHFVQTVGVFHPLLHLSTSPISADLQYLHSILRT